MNLYELKLDKKKLKFIISRLFPLSKFIGKVTLTFCPFHMDVNKPSAKMFFDEDGVERLYCFACNKQFTSYDYLKQILLLDPYNYLIENSNQTQLRVCEDIYEQSQLEKNLNQDKIDFILEQAKNFKHSFHDFIEAIYSG